MVASPTAEGCDQIGAYIDELRGVTTSAKVLWKQSLPTLRYFDQMTDEESEDFLFGATPDELRRFAGFFDGVIALLEEVDVPPVAQAFHRQHVQGVRLAANMLRESATLGIFVAGLVYLDMIDESDALEDVQAQTALAVCPAFQEVIDVYADDSIATPAASLMR